MTLYLDTSALVKLYVMEIDSDTIHRTVAAADRAVASILAYPEVRSAFARKRRMRQLGEVEFHRTSKEFETDWVHFDKLPVNLETVRLAGDFADRFRLKAYDAVHLATADRLRAAIGVPVTFACADDALNAAASKLGMRLVHGL